MSSPSSDTELKVLETLSFLEPMRMEQIVMDFDDDFLSLNQDFAKEDLEVILESLVKRKKVKLIQGKEKQWIKVYPRKKSLLQGLLSFFKRSS